MTEQWWRDRGCTCEFGRRPLGRLYGICMGTSIVLTKCDPDCVAHSLEFPGRAPVVTQ